MKINDYFDKIICINLDKRPDRWREVQSQFKKAGISVQRFSAIDGNPRGYAHVKDDPTGKRSIKNISEHIVTCERMITTTCYAIKNTCYDLALDTVFEQHPWFHTAIARYLAAYIQPKCKSYAFHPPLAWQRASYSDIQNGHRDYSNMMKVNNMKK